MRFRPFQHLYQQLRQANPPLADTLDRIHNALQELTSQAPVVTPTGLSVPQLTLIINGSYGVEGVATSIALIATGGVQPYTYEVVVGSGSVPTGMTLHADTGIIDGTPTVPGTYTFTARVTDSSVPAETADLNCTITIAPTGTPTLAPNVTGAMVFLNYRTWAHVTVPVFNGTMILPDPLGTLAIVEIFAIAPADFADMDVRAGDRIKIARYDSGFTPGAAFAFSGWNSKIWQTSTVQANWKLVFVCYNSSYYPTPTPYESAPFTIPALGITALGAVDDTADRWSEGSVLHGVIAVTVSCANYPQTVTLWTKYASSTGPGYGRKMQGWFEVTAAGKIVYLGAKPGTPIASGGTPTFIFPPAGSSAENVTIYAAIGTYDDTVDPTLLVGVQAFTFSMSPATSMTGGSSSDASVLGLTYPSASGGACDFVLQGGVTLNLADPNFKSATVTLQTGHGTGVGFVAAGAHPVETNIGSWAGPTLGYPTPDKPTDWYVAGGVLWTAVQIVWFLRGVVPSDGNTTHRLRIYVKSVADEIVPNSIGTLQTNWPAGASYYDQVIDGTKAIVSKVLTAHAAGTAVIDASNADSPMELHGPAGELGYFRPTYCSFLTPPHGSAALTAKDTLNSKAALVINGAEILAESGDPNGSISAPPGSLYLNYSGGAGTSLYVKESGISNTGWVAYTSGTTPYMPTIVDITGFYALGSIYQNSTSPARLVKHYVIVQLGPGYSMEASVGASSPPTMILDKEFNQHSTYSQYMQVQFEVPHGWYFWLNVYGGVGTVIKWYVEF